MQLLKQRDFSAMFTDTFQFIKENAQHYFLNFFIINGLFIILYAGFNAFLSKYVAVGDFSPLTMIYILVLFILAIVYWVFSPVYMLLYQKYTDQFNYATVLKFISENAGKILIYILISLFMTVLLGLGMLLIALLLIITIVGILVLPILFSFLSVWFQLTFMEYLNSDKSYFDAMGYAFNLMTKNFWANVGSNALIQLIIIVLYYLAIGIFGMFSAFTEMGTNQVEALQQIQELFSSPIFMVIVALMLIASSMIYINIGIIYFSQKEQLENIAAHSSIDDLGQ